MGCSTIKRSIWRAPRHPRESRAEFEHLLFPSSQRYPPQTAYATTTMGNAQSSLQATSSLFGEMGPVYFTVSVPSHIPNLWATHGGRIVTFPELASPSFNPFSTDPFSLSAKAYFCVTNDSILAHPSSRSAKLVDAEWVEVCAEKRVLVDIADYTFNLHITPDGTKEAIDDTEMVDLMPSLADPSTCFHMARLTWQIRRIRRSHLTLAPSRSVLSSISTASTSQRTSTRYKPLLHKLLVHFASRARRSISLNTARPYCPRMPSGDIKRNSRLSGGLRIRLFKSVTVQCPNQSNPSTRTLCRSDTDSRSTRSKSNMKNYLPSRRSLRINSPNSEIKTTQRWQTSRFF